MSTNKADQPPESRATADDCLDERVEPGDGAMFPIVGIGASAGGLEAFTELLEALPLDTGMGFVLVQHLDPQHESALTQILTRATSLPVHEAKNNLQVEANHVYVIPPNTSLDIAQGVLKLQPRPKTRAPTRSIDSFFEALAQDQRERAIGVILSGTATDGTLGLEAIKAEGGITFAQDDSAKYDSMPRSAVAAGCVDYVLAPEQIAKELTRIAKHPYVVGQLRELLTTPEDDRASATEHEDDESPLPSGGHGTPKTGVKQPRADAERDGRERATGAENGFKKILLLLRNHSGVDFSLYKSTTIQRRITRRMVLGKQDTPEDYAGFLRGNGKELDALYSDMLISVTSFFRNPEAFDVLMQTVFPKLLKQRGDDPLRVWVLGCSTGQEAYSIAMSFLEAAEKAPRSRKLQVFATDLNDALLDKARHGLYAKSLAQDVSPERLRRFFVEEEGGYRVTKQLREMVVFARQNLINDPPFSRLDLISCRNLLIYLEPSLQKKALPTFHYALKPEGFLFLGASESIGSFTDLFEPADKKYKLYSKKAAPTPAFHLPVKKQRGEPPRRGTSLLMASEEPDASQGLWGELNAQREADRVTVTQFAPPGVLINADLQIIQFRGPAGAYLEPPSGKATFDVLKIARQGLMLPLRTAINRAKKENKTVRKENVRIEHNGGTRVVNLQVIPLKNLKERCFLILFEDAEKTAQAGDRAPSLEEPRVAERTPPPATKKEESRRIAELEADLSETRDYAQSVQEQHEAANEELQAANEEVQSANEELQSINEELETSKEELESANEELTTVNEEMANRNTELNRLNSDLVNLQSSTKLAIILLGRDLTIRRFSAEAEKQFGLSATDVGRPISSVRHNLVFESPAHRQESEKPKTGRGKRTQADASKAIQSRPDLESLIAEVIANVRERECEVRDKASRWYSLRVRPYMTLDNKVDGAVLVLVDIDTLKRSELAIATARDFAENTIETVREPLIVLDGELHVESANRSFYRSFRVAPADTIGKSLFDLGNRQWKIPRLRTLLEEVLSQNKTVEDLQVEHDFEHIGLRTMLLNARCINDPARQTQRILLAIEDITERRHRQQELQQARDYAEAIVRTVRDPMLILNGDLRVHSANDAYCTTFKVSPTQLEGRSVYDLGNGQWKNRRLRTLLEDVLPRNSFFDDFEVTHDFEAIGRRTMLLNARPLSASSGQPARILLGIQDVTELLHYQTELRRSESRYRRLFEAAQDGVLIVDPKTGRILDANPFMTKLLDYARDELLGKQLFEIGLLKDEAASRSAFRELQRRGFIRYDDLPLETKSGQCREVEMVSNLYDEGGEKTIQCNVRDITERRRAEAALRASEERYRTLFELGPAAVYSCDAAGVIQQFNRRAAELWGREPAPGDTDERFCGSFKLFRPDGSSMPHEQCPMAEVVAGTIPAADDAEVLIERPDGSRVAVIVNIRSLKNKQGEVTGAINCFYDITERKHAEETLKEVDRRKNEFLAMLAHELRNPLAPLRNAVQILRLTDSDADTVRAASEMMERQLSQMVRLVDDLLDVSRISRSKIELRRRRIELASVVDQAAEAARPVCENMEHALIVTMPPQPIYLNADPTRLAQVVGNLLNNACKFTHKGGRISLAVEREDEQAVIRVRDTGIGIAADQLPRIFDLFTQVDTSLERSISGLGIGLTLVKSLVEMHDGTVEGRSAGAGQGSEFVVRLPIMLEPPKPPPEPTVSAPPPAKARRILVVDDNPDSAESLAMLLKLTGNETHAAYDGLEAVETAARIKPELVLLDIGLPKLNGYEVCRRIREQPWGKDMVLVALTGWGQEEDRQRSRDAGFDGHMVKPVEYDTLIKLLAGLKATNI